MTFDCLEIEDNLNTLEPISNVMEEIKRMIHDLLQKLQHLVTGGMLTVLLVGTMPQVAASTYQVLDNKPQVVIDNSGAVPVAHDAASFYYHHERLFDSIDRLRALSDGWDGGCAKAPSIEALNMVGTIVEYFDEKVLSHCALFPSNDSGLFLQGRFSKGRLSLYLNADKMTYILKNKDGRFSQSSIGVDKNSIEELQTMIFSLLLDENA